MTLVRIHILTTEHVAEIQNISEEPLDFSMAFQDGAASQLNFGYDDFVKSPNGLIERITGHASYRLDLSRPIESGDSWQLPVYLAHLLLAENKLANRWQAEDRVSAEVFATGFVGFSGRPFVRPVDKIASKLAQLDALLVQKPCSNGLLILPSENAGDPAVNPFLQRYPGFRLIALDDEPDAITNAISAITSLPERTPPRGQPSAALESAEQTNGEGSSRRKAVIFFVAGLAALAISYIVLSPELLPSRESDAPAGDQPVPPDSVETGTSATVRVPVEIAEQRLQLVRVPEDHKCGALRFEQSLGVTDQLIVEPYNDIRLRLDDSLCGAELALKLDVSTPSALELSIVGENQGGETRVLHQQRLNVTPPSIATNLPIDIAMADISAMVVAINATALGDNGSAAAQRKDEGTAQPDNISFRIELIR